MVHVMASTWARRRASWETRLVQKMGVVLAAKDGSIDANELHLVCSVIRLLVRF
jgi:hypothetical protein